MLYFVLGISTTLNVIFILVVLLLMKLKNKFNPLKKIESFYENDIEDKNAFSSFFGGK